MSGEALGFGSNEVGSIPICELNDEQIERVNNLVDMVLALNSSENLESDVNKLNTIKEYEQKIDLIVYKLYDLTYSEVKTIDPEFLMSEEEYNQFAI